MPRVSKKEQKIDEAILATNKCLDTANLRLKLIQAEIMTLEEQLSTLVEIKNQK